MKPLQEGRDPGKATALAEVLQILLVKLHNSPNLQVHYNTVLLQYSTVCLSICHAEAHNLEITIAITFLIIRLLTSLHSV